MTAPPAKEAGTGCAGCLGIILIGWFFLCGGWGNGSAEKETQDAPQADPPHSVATSEPSPKKPTRPAPEKRTPLEKKWDDAKLDAARKKAEAKAAAKATAAAKEEASRKLGRSWDATKLSREYVKQYLNFPLTAKFPYFGGDAKSTHYYNLGVDGWITASTVTAKNAFGVPTEHGFEVRLQSAENNYRLITVTIDGKIVAIGNSISDLAKKQDAKVQEIVDSAQREIEQAAAAAEREASFRIWTSTAGTTLEARFASQLGKTVTLEKRDGTKIKLPISKLSNADQAFIAAKQKR